MPKPAAPKLPTIGFMELYQFSTPYERSYAIGGLCASIIAGLVTPTYALVIGKIVEMFDPSLSIDQVHEKMYDSIPMIIVVAVLTFFSNWVGYSMM